jgi:hypothetical protein
MILNQCCSETLLKIVFQQHRPKANGHREIDVEDPKRDLSRAQGTYPPSCLLALRSDGTKCLRRKLGLRR